MKTHLKIDTSVQPLFFVSFASALIIRVKTMKFISINFADVTCLFYLIKNRTFQTFEILFIKFWREDEIM